MSNSSSHSQKLCGRYQPVKIFSNTSSASILEVVDDNGHRYAAKVSRINRRKTRKCFLTEFQIYFKLTAGQLMYDRESDGKTPHGFADLHFVGHHNHQYDVIVMDLLSADLSTLSNETLWGFDFKFDTYLTLARDMLFAVMALHQHGFIHRDVKPHNFRLSGGFSPCLLGFTVAKRYTNEKTNRHCEHVQESSFTGTLEYASLNAHAHMSQSRRDDLISLGYTIIDMMQKGLPWGQQHTDGKCLTYKSCFIRNVKENLRHENLCAGLPLGVLYYMRIVSALSFDALPDYFLLHTLLDSRSQEHLSNCVLP